MLAPNATREGDPMRRYLIQHPRVADCICWGDTPEAALGAAREMLGIPMSGATATPFTGLADLPLSQHLAHPRLGTRPTITTDEE
jgi:hypothetical protein